MKAGGRGLTNVQFVHVVIDKNEFKLSNNLAEDPSSGGTRIINTERGLKSTEAEPSKSPEPNLCTICGMTFGEKSAFNSHIKVHLKEKLIKRAKLFHSSSPSTSSNPSCSEPALNDGQLIHNTLRSRPFKVKIEAKDRDSPNDQMPNIQLASTTSVMPDVDIKHNFIKSEISSDIRIGKEELNTDLCSILDDIEKDFKSPSAMTMVNSQGLRSTGDQPQPLHLSSLLSENCVTSDGGFGGHSSDEDFSFGSLGSSAASSVEDKDAISFEKLLDINSLPSLLHNSSATQRMADHDYLLEQPAHSVVDTNQLHPGGVRATSESPAVSQSPAQSESQSSLFTQRPGKLIIQRSPLNPKILNIYRITDALHAKAKQTESQSLSVVKSKPMKSTNTSDSKVKVAGKAKGKHSSTCTVCGKTITTKNMARHMEKHTGKKKFQCDICQASFYQKTHLKNHIALHESGEMQECGECGQKFVRKADYFRHIRTAHSSDSSCTCNVCGFLFPDNKRLELHQVTMHGKNKKELCGLCGNKFDDKAAMIRHMQEHSREEQLNVFNCQLCEKKFAGKAELEKHLQSHQTALFGCKVCGHQLNSMSALSAHAVLHPACLSCGSTFLSEAELQIHASEVHARQFTSPNRHQQQQFSFMSPRSLSSVDVDFLEDDPEECFTPLSGSSSEVLHSSQDISPCPSSIESFGGDLLEVKGGCLSQLIGNSLESEDASFDVGNGEKRSNLSLDAISDSSYFNISNHLDDDFLCTELFAN